ncbi:MAG: LptF/LptG family permease [candidate division Zixibacteria bacterium]|nr:LptF/LptG family permease [candidate division Zixibacteria bacterium]
MSRYILKEHIGPFIFAFFIVTFVLIIDFIPQVVELIVGRDLSTWTVLKYFVLNLAWMLALSVPMAVLVSTLMAFGRLTADNEILGIKSSGVNMLRLMLPVIFVASLLGVGLIWFNNNVLPDANHAASNLKGDIKRTRPTIELKSGVFIDYIPGYIILIDKVDHETSSLKGVIIYDQKNQKVAKTITADSGRVEFSAQGQYITFHLLNGQVHEQDLTRESSYRLLAFESQTFLVQNLGTRLEETDHSYRGDREMSTAQLARKTGAWSNEIRNYQKMIIEETDSAINTILAPRDKAERLKTTDPKYIQQAALGKAAKMHNDVFRLLRTRKGQIHSNERLVSKYGVEIHKKYSLPAACLAFVLIGAPLGVMGRKRGMAISVGVSIALFTVYWAFLIGGEQLADRLILPPWVAMWIANVLMVSIGLLLLYKVKNEKPIGVLLAHLFWRRK